jgi:two-component system, NarL family, invasion response regulator UvrY
MLRVAIVDDHEIIRAGFHEMLAGELGLAIAFEAGSGEEALARLQDTECDVLLLDLALPGQSGIDVLRTLRQRHSALHVLVLTAYPEERYALPMLRNGADGYLCKECGRDELLKAVRVVAQGRRYLSPHMAQILADEVTGNSPAPLHQRLSERELQVFLRLAEGRSVSEIGKVLHLSVKTVSTYRTRLLEKLGVASNAELAAYAVRNGLLAE